MKIIDLLVKIANGEEVPKKIKYDGLELIYSNLKQDYMRYYSNGNGDYLFQYLFDKCRSTTHFINDEVKIIEDEPKMRIKEINFRQEKGETLIGANMWEFYYRLSELRKAVNYLLEKSDKE